MTGAVQGASAPIARVEAPVRYRENGHNVTEFKYALPQGQHSNLVGSFSYRQPSIKAGQLQAKIAVEKRKLQQIKLKEAATLKFQPRKKKRLECKIKYLESQLNCEIQSLGVVRVHVHELDGDA